MVGGSVNSVVNARYTFAYSLVLFSILILCRRLWLWFIVLVGACL